MQIQPPRKSARRLFCLYCSRFAVRSADPKARMAPFGGASHRAAATAKFVGRSRVRKFSYTALCIATKREYGLNDEFQK